MIEFRRIYIAMKKITTRLNIIKGQIGAISRMIESNEKDCFKVLTQLKAVKSALNSASSEIVKSMLKECTREGGIENSKFDKILKEI